MITLDEYWNEIGLPCEFCKVWACTFPPGRCVHSVRNLMYFIAEEMLLRGEY